ncbi:hypothetical protein Hanom_Chr16g01492931 [Helianthus anomalus]
MDFLNSGAYVTVIARSLGLVPEENPQLLPPVAPTRMGFQMLWGMGLIKRFDVLSERFKTRAGFLFQPRDLPEQFNLVYPPPDPDAAVVQDPPVDLDGPAMPQPPAHHHIPGRPVSMSFHNTLFQVMPQELQLCILRYKPSLTS